MSSKTSLGVEGVLVAELEGAFDEEAVEEREVADILLCAKVTFGRFDRTCRRCGMKEYRYCTGNRLGGGIGCTITFFLFPLCVVQIGRGGLERPGGGS